MVSRVDIFSFANVPERRFSSPCVSHFFLMIVVCRVGRILYWVCRPLVAARDAVLKNALVRIVYGLCPNDGSCQVRLMCAYYMYMPRGLVASLISVRGILQRAGAAACFSCDAFPAL